MALPVSLNSKIIEDKILFIRGEKVLLDRDLAELYGVETRIFNQAVKRNKIRFPEDFMFQITKNELNHLISQNVISSSDWGGRRKLPYAFTEHGAIMAAAVLRSQRADLVLVMETLRKLINKPNRQSRKIGF